MSNLQKLSSQPSIPAQFEAHNAEDCVGEAPNAEDGEEEDPIDAKDGVDEASPEGRESEALGRPGEDPASDQLTEDPIKDAADCVEAGHSVEQLPVFIQQGVCGGDNPPELCEYEKLRERNIRERDEAMKEAMDEIDEAKKVMSDNAPGASRKREADGEAGGTRKMKKVDSVVEVRRSGRMKKPVSYVMEDDLDGRSRKRERKISAGRRKGSIKSPIRSARGRVASRPDSPPSLPSSSRTLRPRKPVNYCEVPEPEADSFIWCSTCGKEEYNGCEVHVTYFGDNKEFRLEVEMSSVGGEAGQGVVNRGKLIPEGVLFGPYAGKFIPAIEYQKIKESNSESGNAWEIRDQFSNKTVGFIDPGVNPDPQLNWMAKINCPNLTMQQNLVGFQLAGQIYYRVLEDIPCDRELFVWYGDGYAEEIGIDLKTVDKYTGVEDQTEEAKSCDYCGTGMNGVRELELHLGKGNRHVYLCGVKQAKEMVRKAESGESNFVCKVCGKGFKNKRNLSAHASVHTKIKSFKCDVEGCKKKYLTLPNLIEHTKVVHEGVYHECLECGKRFGYKSDMTKHFSTVHEEKKPFKCAQCGKQFAVNSKLTRHIKTVHNKIRSFKCELCQKSFGVASNRKRHIEMMHLNIRYPCTWQNCSHQAKSKQTLKYHIRQVHTKEWSFECKLCEDQLNIWWGCINPGKMNRHRAKKHPVEWEEEQDTYRKDHPFVCKYKKCLNRYKTEVEKDRHQVKMH